MRRPAIFTCLLLMSGCGNPHQFDPATTVILKVTGATDDVESERIKEECIELVVEQSTWHKCHMFRTGERMTIQISPVEDAERFAKRIAFGEVTAIDGNMIHVSMGGDDDGRNEDNGDDPENKLAPDDAE